MTKKKSRSQIKLNKKQRIKLQSIIVPIIVGLACLILGATTVLLVQSRQEPKNIVWASEASVSVPTDLKRYLESMDECQNYRGENTPNGVGLWGVYQVSQAKFAKIAYGCSWSLSSYIMAVESDGEWKLLQPEEYFAPFQGSSETGAIPVCQMIDKYKIDATIEPFCIDSNGAARENTNQ